MELDRRTRRRLRLHNLLLPLLMIGVAAMAAWVSLETARRFDLSASGRHSLSAASIAVLAQLDGEVTVTAFASRRRELRESVQRFLSPWQAHKPDVRLEFVDPATAPEQVRERGISRDGQLLLRHGGREEMLDAATEQAMANTLQRLARSTEHWLAFLQGHGERAPDGEANFDLRTWAQALQARGFRVQGINLAETGVVPDNTSVLVIAGPRVRLLANEVQAIVDFLDAGGRLLWLRDPDSPVTGLAPLAAALGIEWVPGTIVDPAAHGYGLDNPALVVVTGYPQHPITEGLRYATLFPLAGTVAATGGADWTRAAVLRSGDRAWHETGSLDDAVTFDADADYPGPLSIGLALSREHAGEEQRAMVIADGDFLSNRFIGNSGNLDLGLRIANWLVRDDSFISVPAGDRGDRRLAWTEATGIGVFVFLLLVLPLGLAAAGILRWLRRRRA